MAQPNPIRTSIVPVMLAVKAKLAAWTSQVPLGAAMPTAFSVPVDRIKIVAHNRWPEPTQAQNLLAIWSPPISADQNILHGAGRFDLRVRRTIDILARTRMSLDEYASSETFLTDPQFGHYILEEFVIDALQQSFLPDINNNHLLTEPLDFIGAAAAKHETEPTGWGETVLTFAFEMNLAVDQTVQ